MKIVSEDQFSGKTYFYTIAYSVGHATDCVRTDVARSLWGRDAIQ